MARSALADALKPRPAPPGAEAPDPDPGRAPSTESRRGRKAVTIYLDTAAHRQLRMLALEQDSSVQHLAVEAIQRSASRSTGSPGSPY